MSQITSRKVPLGSSIFPHQHRLSALTVQNQKKKTIIADQ
ncbi:hypothetical protein O53_1759 [Microcystis aeruginosa TAIHU98]|uniref:Uncharacterized protein n=1 Tax=Microcystis aeruginosa TAIHU98 TaxID=1134457 RepID=L7EFW7_MICAE|nr:hypothetical protein O53_1759 [Microcystis aeruginosa TAIHU98]